MLVMLSDKDRAKLQRPAADFSAPCERFVANKWVWLACVVAITIGMFFGGSR